MIDSTCKSLKGILEARVGIEPTNKGFADLYLPSHLSHTVNKTAFGNCKVSGLFPVANYGGAR